MKTVYKIFILFVLFAITYSNKANASNPSKAHDDIQFLRKQFIRLQNIKLKKAQVLLEALKVVEESFYRFGYNKKEYQEYKEKLEKEIHERGITSELEVMSTFITESALFIHEKMGRKTL